MGTAVGLPHHIITALYHCVSEEEATKSWLTHVGVGVAVGRLVGVAVGQPVGLQTTTASVMSELWRSLS